MVGVTGFEPATPASRTQCSARLSYTPFHCTARLSVYSLRRNIPYSIAAPANASIDEDRARARNRYAPATARRIRAIVSS